MLTGVDPRWIALLVVAALIVVLLVTLRRPRYPAGTSVLKPSPYASTGALPDDVRTEIDRLVASDQKIKAIKVLRTAVPGLSLKDGKDVVDAWHRTGEAALLARLSGPSDAELSPEALTEIDDYIAAGKPIRAIKSVREQTGWGLVDAKQWVDARTAGR
jgi:ribosomal protein L7/L12